MSTSTTWLSTAACLPKAYIEAFPSFRLLSLLDDNDDHFCYTIGTYRFRLIQRMYLPCGLVELRNCLTKVLSPSVLAMKFERRSAASCRVTMVMVVKYQIIPDYSQHTNVIHFLGQARPALNRWSARSKCKKLKAGKAQGPTSVHDVFKLPRPGIGVASRTSNTGFARSQDLMPRSCTACRFYYLRVPFTPTVVAEKYYPSFH